MNKKAQASMELGPIMIVFIGVLVGVILFQTIAQDVGSSTNLITTDNLTLTVGAVSLPVDVVGQTLSGTPTVRNSTGGVGAFTIRDGIDYVINETVSTSTGVKTISFFPLTANATSQDVNITYTYGPDGYIEDSGARSMALLIPIFFALSIAVVALSPTLRSELLTKMGR
jgi:hypothetical protein